MKTANITQILDYCCFTTMPRNLPLLMESTGNSEGVSLPLGQHYPLLSESGPLGHTGYRLG